MKSAFLSLAVACALASAASAQSWAWDDGTVPFVVSPPEVVDRMLRLAEPRPGELLVDLGSGDGRIVIEAAKRYGARGLGVDIDPSLVARATENARRAGVEALARFQVQDFFETDLRGVSVVTMYLLPEVNLKLMPKLLQDLKPGARVVSHDYEMGGWRPDETIELTVAEKMVGPTGRSRVHLWFVPADVRGTWRSELKEHGGSWEFRVEQIYQRLDIVARASGIEVAVRGTRLRGDEVKVVVSGNVGGKPWNHLFRGILKGDRIEGELLVSDGENNRTLPWTAIRTR
jgi:SAM-dependent methyltransferase